MKLYELANAYGKLQDKLELAETDKQTVIDELEKIEGEFIYKVEQVAKMVITLESNVSACEDEVNRLNAKKKTFDNKIEWIKTYLLQSLKDAQIDKVKGQMVNISIRENPKSVRILSVDEIPTEFKEKREETVVKKVAILAHFKETGEIVNGIEIYNTERVDIR
jgi:predicted nuclease with TOPRIM domain